MDVRVSEKPHRCWRAPTEVERLVAKPPQQGTVCAPLPQSSALFIAWNASHKDSEGLQISPEPFHGALHLYEYRFTRIGIRWLWKRFTQADEQFRIWQNDGKPAQACKREASACKHRRRTQTPFRLSSSYQSLTTFCHSGPHKLSCSQPPRLCEDEHPQPLKTTYTTTRWRYRTDSAVSYSARTLTVCSSRSRPKMRSRIWLSI